MKISVVGAGSAGCLTALQLGFDLNCEVELIYNPEIPPEVVGQGTVLLPPALLWEATRFNWYDNPIHATFKTGILYEGWGKVNDKVFHPFPADKMGMHFCPWEMQEHVLKSGNFKVTEGDVDPKDVDADYVFDCRGKPDDLSDYYELRNPTNACILGKPKWDTSEAYWSRHVATPDGWTFIIPAKEDSPSHSGAVGYCYNSNITKKEEAEYNFLEMFDVEVTKHIEYKNYGAKNPIDGRVILNGNRLFFLEPLESSATQAYVEWTGYFIRNVLSGRNSSKDASWEIRNYIGELQNFVLWHYQFGSKYDTPFWDYAKTFTFEDKVFDEFLNYGKKDWKGVISSPEDIVYAQWNPYSFKVWYDGMTNH